MRISIPDIKAIHSSARDVLMGKWRSARRRGFCLVLARFACATILSGTSFAQSNPPLNFGDNFFVTGDYVVAGAHGMTTTFSNGYAVGTFTIPDANPGIHDIRSVPRALRSWPPSFTGKQSRTPGASPAMPVPARMDSSDR